MATLAGRTTRPRQTFEVNPARWRYRQMARYSASDLSKGASHRFASICARSSSVAIPPPIMPKQAGLAVEGWLNGLSPTIDGKAIKLKRDEQSRSLAIHPDGGPFML